MSLFPKNKHFIRFYADFFVPLHGKTNKIKRDGEEEDPIHQPGDISLRGRQ